jgi:hypothetical protein
MAATRITNLVQSKMNSPANKMMTATGCKAKILPLFHVDTKRMHMHIGGPDAKSTKGQGEDENAKLLEDFAGPNAAHVLSCVMNQGTLAALMDEMPTQSGNNERFFALMQKNHLKNNTVRHVAAADGKVSNPEKDQFGGAKWTLSEKDGFYEVQLDWPTYFNEIGSGLTDKRAILKDSSLKMNISCTMLINKAKADKEGELEFIFKEPPVATFDGRIEVQP